MEKTESSSKSILFLVALLALAVLIAGVEFGLGGGGQGAAMGGPGAWIFANVFMLLPWLGLYVLGSRLNEEQYGPPGEASYESGATWLALIYSCGILGAWFSVPGLADAMEGLVAATLDTDSKVVAAGLMVSVCCASGFLAGKIWRMSSQPCSTAGKGLAVMLILGLLLTCVSFLFSFNTLRQSGISGGSALGLSMNTGFEDNPIGAVLGMIRMGGFAGIAFAGLALVVPLVRALLNDAPGLRAKAHEGACQASRAVCFSLVVLAAVPLCELLQYFLSSDEFGGRNIDPPASGVACLALLVVSYRIKQQFGTISAVARSAGQIAAEAAPESSGEEEEAAAEKPAVAEPSELQASVKRIVGLLVGVAVLLALLYGAYVSMSQL